MSAFPALRPYSQGYAFDSGASIFAQQLLGCFIACSLVWLIGIAVIATPLWWLLERRVAATWPTAAAFGAVLPAALLAVVIAIIEGMDARRLGTGFQWSFTGGWAYIFFLSVMGIGCAVGVAMWRFAYRRAITSTVADTFS